MTGDDFENDLLVLIADVARHMRTNADQIARARGMTRAQWFILVRVERQPGLSQNELAALAEVTPITVARLVDRLEELGLVERVSDPGDRRIWRLHLTPAASPVLREIRRYRAKLRRFATNGLGSDVLETMIVGLRKMKENLNSRRMAETAA